VTISVNGNAAEFEKSSYPAILDAMPDMIICIDREGVFLNFKGAINELYRPMETYMGKHLQEVLPEDTAGLFMFHLKEAFETGQVQHMDYTLTFDDGLRHYEARMVRSTANEAIVIVRNVTKRKRMEAQIHRYQENLRSQMEARTADWSMAENRYHSIFRHSGSPSIMVDQDFTVSMVNPKFEELTGYPRDEIENRMKWTDFIHTDDRKMVHGYHFARRAKDGSAPSEYECRMIDREGDVKHIFTKVGMLPEPGRTIVSLIDITSLKRTTQELKDREALYSAILEGYLGFVYFIGQDCKIAFMNENLIRQVGFDATGKYCYEALHKRRSKCVWCVSDQVFNGQTVRFEMKNPNDQKWYSSVNVPIRLSDGTLYCQAMIRDIDERKRMEQALRDSEAHLLEENIRLRSTIEDRHRFGDIIGKSPVMQEVYELMLMAASSDTNIILYGESGTGKELVARAIHNMSVRRDKPFVPVNCGAIPESLLEREFFGHRKGAFTGAERDAQGFIGKAEGGGLFLDEIGEIKQDLQVKLLRAIEGGGYSPIGSNEVLKPDFRIIAATSRNLPDLVKKGQMRSDFFYRIHVIPIHLPPLRERKEDIPLLVDHFLKAYDRQIRPKVTARVIDTLMNYNWPGNVRELQNVMFRFVTLKRLDLVGGTSPMPALETDEAAVDAQVATLSEAMAGFEKKQIYAALAQHRWNRTHTAKTLGIGLRTLQRKMQLHGLN
jgi:PAS domain S-box-containing protein